MEFRPPILKDIYRASKYSWNEGSFEINPMIDDNGIYFIHSNFLKRWHGSNKFKPRGPYHLFSGFDDHSIGDGYLDIANDPNLISWHAANLVIKHPKLHPIPISVIGGKACDKDDDIMLELSRARVKSTMLYANYETWTNPTERNKCLQYTKLPLRGRVSRAEYLKELSESFFCVSPDGHGIDCHRVWESLSVGTIPVITRNPMVELGLYDGLPVFIIDSWEGFDASVFTENLYARMMLGFDKSRLNILNWVKDDELRRRILLGSIPRKPSVAIDGWMAVNELEWLTGAAKGKKLILEIGSWKGRSSKAIVEGMLPGSMLMCMDTWRGSDNEELHDIAKSPEDPIYKEFCTNLRYEIETGMVVPLRMDSTDGLKHLASLGMKFDMIFLDANHSFEGVSSDCRNAIPLLAPGGLMCGHDWCPAWSTVIAAVNDVFPGRCRPVTGTIWTAEP